MSSITITHSLDWGHHYHLILEYAPRQQALFGRISGPAGSTGTVERHLATLIALYVDGKPHRLTLTESGLPSLAADLGEAGEHEILLRLGGSEQREGEIFGRYRMNSTHVISAEIPERLTVFETRMLGNEKLYRWLPYPRSRMALPVLRTDLHTHSSGQISAQGLIAVAINHAIGYPTRLLDLLGINYAQKHVHTIPRFFFPPTDAGAIIPKEEDGVLISTLSTEDREKLRVAMAIPADRQLTFGDLELTVYRYRTPISKHPDAAYDLLLMSAQEYAKQGIVYAEITASSTSLLNPDYMAFLHESLPAIEKATGVKLRFLAGLPRNLPPPMLTREIEKLELMGNSPYIVGIDFMGFEDNKIGDLEPYIQSIAAWAAANDPEFTLRIHAGENRKNMTNVRESLRLAQKYRMRVRIGHAAHGLDDEAIRIAGELARDKLAMIEFNPDSNLALNNIDTVEELDLPRCVNSGIPFVVCSDGGGLYQTDAKQLAMTAFFAAAFSGVSGVGESIAQSERDHLAREETRFARKLAALPADFFERVRTTCQMLPPLVASTDSSSQQSTEYFEQHLRRQGIAFTPDSIAAATRDKLPLLILGATGQRHWDMILPEHRTQIQTAIELLVQQLDPRHVYFMIGRPKDTGITPLLSRAVHRYNAMHPQKFALISATVQADQTIHSFTPGLTHVLPLKGSLFTVPDQLVSYVEETHGHILFIGGGTFVRDAILIAREKKVSFGLMKGPPGASTDKAVMTNPAHQFTDAESLLTHLREAKPQIFRHALHGTVPLGLRLIATLKFVTATLLAAASFGLFRLINKDVGDVLEEYCLKLHLDPENRFINSAIDTLDAMDAKHLKAIGGGTLFYSMLYYIESVGLWLGRHWAEYLVIIATGALLPLEIYELVKKITAIRFLVLAVNLVIVAYLIYQLKQDRKAKHPH